MASPTDRPPLVVAAIDFGTTFSGWAFSFLHEFESDPMKVSMKLRVGGPQISQKEPTSILIRKDDETVDSFGFEAETRYAEEKNKEDFYFFSRFKMMLHGKIGIDRNIMLKDPTGKELSAKKVFTLAIKYLMDDVKKDIRKQNEGLVLEEDMRIVLTVPAIWNDAAKQFMREAATEAGIPDDKLVIVLKPEAAIIYCRHMPVSKQEKDDKVSLATLMTGSKYIVLDAGGRTVNITVHEVLETGHLKEVHPPTSGAWGGALVDMAFKDFLDKCAGEKVMDHIKRKHPEDFMEIMRYFEMQKRNIHPGKTKTVTIRLPMSSFTEAAEETGQPFIKDKLEASAYCTKAKIKGDKLILDFELVESFFTNSENKIVEQIKNLLAMPAISNCFEIIMMGELSETELLQDKIRASFPDKKIIIPNEVGLSALNGAVIFGHRTDLISRRASSTVRPPLVVAAIDFGTTFSGWAFSFRHEFESDPTRVSLKLRVGGPLISQKEPTSILIRKDDETVDSFGFAAETRYAEEENKDDFYFFSRFKMMLYGKIGIDRNIMLKDPTGKELAAKKVFSLAIKYLMDEFKKDIRKQNEGLVLEEDMRIVLTVPAIWNDAAKQFMREAATEAGISDDKLVIALEPEAASIDCRHLPVSKQEKGDKVSIATLKTGSKYIVLDAGGGTVDVTVHEILGTGHLKEVHPPTGGAWGGVLVDMAFKDFLNKCAGKKVMGHIKKKHPEDFMEIMRYFEMQKRNIHSGKTKTFTVRLPVCSFTEAAEETGQPFIKDKLEASAFSTKAKIKGDKLILDFELFESFFTNSENKIVEHIKSLLSIPAIADCFGIIMVGGLSESELLQDKIRASFPDKKIIIPNEAGLSVLKGAVIFGHRPELISRRVSKYTYGCNIASRDVETYFDGEKIHSGRLIYVRNVFNTLVHAGEDVKVGENKDCGPVFPLSPSQTKIRFNFYKTEKESPRYVTDDGCSYVGTLNLDISSFRMARINIRVVLGGTELKVELENVSSREKKYFFINCLG